MKRTQLLKITSFILSVLMLAGTFTAVLPVYAADGGTSGSTAGNGTTLQQISDALNAKSYLSYMTEHADAKRATKSVTVEAVDYVKDAEATTAKVEVVSNFEGVQGDSLRMPDTGKVTWSVDIPETGLYAVKITYYPIENKANSIERMFYINGKVPFAEARYLAMTRIWINGYNEENGGFNSDFTEFKQDTNGNDVRPEQMETPRWREYTLSDSNGYYTDPFEFYFEKGENTFALEGVREPVVIKDITLFPYENLPTYDEVKAEYASKGYAASDAEPVRIEAEFPLEMSHRTIYPINDRTSAITYPQDPVLIRLNTIGRDKWQQVGNWITYEFEVKKDGLYTIALRFIQDELNGLNVARRLYIDGEIPFEECTSLRFPYSNNWQSKRLGQDSKDDEPYEFYLTAGKHTLTLEVALGDLGPIVRDVTDALNVINDAYLSILKLTGTNPDEYRDYGFNRVIPGTIQDLITQGKKLEGVVEELEKSGRGENTATLSKVQRLVEEMGADEDEIAPNLELLKSYIGTLGTWVNTVTKQPLEVDYIMVQPKEADLPRASANFFQSLWFEIRSFVGSFYTDYNSLGSTTEDGGEKKESVDVWVASDRDRATIVRNLIDNRFTPNTGVGVNLKLVAGGTLLPSVLAGVGPDVSLLTGDGDVINYAIRGALQGMNDKRCISCKKNGVETLQYVGDGDYVCEVCGADGADNWEVYFDTFDEVTKRFSNAATIPLTLYGETFAIPETQTFPMLFYRKDILADLGLEVPRTWDEVLALIPVLQFNNMEVGLTADYLTYLYQMGGEQYADNGMRVNLDSNISLAAFQMMCNMFTMYSLPFTYDPANRFRTGEIPVMVQPYTLYNQLVVFATEIAGLWEFTVMPGMEQEDGSINNTAVAGVQGVVMLEGSKRKQSAWDFIDWYTDADFQASYSNELVALLGDAGMNPTANIEALAELSWTSTEYNNLRSQFDALTAVPNYPGSYIIARYTDFAFKAAYNDGADPTTALLGYINTINKEFSRKREEFGLETLEVGQKLSDKRIEQARDEISKVSASERDKYKSQLDALTAAMDAATGISVRKGDLDALVSATNALKATGSSTFDTAVKFLDDAIAALNTYQLSAE